MMECCRHRGIWWSVLTGDLFRAILARLRGTQSKSKSMRKRVWEMERWGDLNAFLKQHRVRINRVFDGEGRGKAKILLSGTSNCTSLMVAAICYAWLLENKVGNDADGCLNEVVMAVINVRRSRMWKLRQAAWLFHHAIDKLPLVPGVLELIGIGWLL